MAIVSMTRQEANAKLKAAYIPRDIHGTYSIIDVLVAFGLLHIQPEKVVLYENSTFKHGSVRLQTTQDGLELWIGGELKYQHNNS